MASLVAVETGVLPASVAMKLWAALISVSEGVSVT